MPTGLDLERVIAGFEERGGFPQCGGAIDGTHIPIIVPKDYPVSYYNRKGFYSMVMQAVYDHEFCQMIHFNGWNMFNFCFQVVIV